MAGRRILCLLLQLACLAFYWAYQEWMSWILLLFCLGLPWLSLAVSLPAMLSCRVRPNCPEAVTMGYEITASYHASCQLPLPRFRGILRLRHSFAPGKALSVRSGTALPTHHCGTLTLSPDRIWIQDYLGVFRLPVLRHESASMLIRPQVVTPAEKPDVSRYLVSAWRPKPGGGFSENHELRLFRPGDSLRQIHWKLSAKTGKYILREPMEPLRGLAIITLTLSGSPESLDSKLGQLLWVSDYLLGKDVPHQIHCFSGKGMEVFPVSAPEHTGHAVDALLGSPPADPQARPVFAQASWRYHIGGDGHEA